MSASKPASLCIDEARNSAGRIIIHSVARRHGAVGGCLHAIVVDLDVCHVRHEFDEVQLCTWIALADFLFWNWMATCSNASLDARDVQFGRRQSAEPNQDVMRF